MASRLCKAAVLGYIAQEISVDDSATLVVSAINGAPPGDDATGQKWTASPQDKAKGISTLDDAIQQATTQSRLGELLNDPYFPTTQEKTKIQEALTALANLPTKIKDQPTAAALKTLKDSSATYGGQLWAKTLITEALGHLAALPTKIKEQPNAAALKTLKDSSATYGGQLWAKTLIETAEGHLDDLKAEIQKKPDAAALQTLKDSDKYVDQLWAKTLIETAEKGLAEAAAKKYKDIVGAAYTGDTKTHTAAQIQTAACAAMYVSYKDLATPTTADLGITGLELNGDVVTKCDVNAFSVLGTKMLKAWKADAEALNLTIAHSTATIDGDSTNVKKLLLDALQKRYETLTTGGKVALTVGDAFNKRIKVVKQELFSKTTPEYEKVARRVYGQMLNDAKPLTPQLVTLSLEIANAKKEPQQEAPAATPKTETEKADDEAAATVGGVFGVLAGLAIAFVGLLFSPCFQYDFKNHAFDWEKNYQKPDYYKELDGDARHWRNEVNEAFGLPEEQPPKEPAGKVDSAAASSSALTLVPVVVLAGGVFAVARRGLKRRAQKKAKRVSRAQQKLHEDL